MKTFLRTMCGASVVLLAAACSSPPARRTETAPQPPSVPVEAAPADVAPTPEQLRATAQAEAITTVLDDTTGRAAVTNAVASFYDTRDYKPAWFDDNHRPRPVIRALLDVLGNADRQGLTAASYGPDTLSADVRRLYARQPAEPDDRALAALDARLSLAFVAYARDLHQGRLPGRDVGLRWRRDQPATDYAGALARLAAQGDVAAILADLKPPHAGYTQLVEALADYRTIVKNGGWPTIGDGPLVTTGMRDPRVPALRRHLRITGDLPAPTPGGQTSASTRFGEALADALRRFQRRHGLAVDGRLGPDTRAALDVPAAWRMRQIELNLERWRWLPPDLGRRYIMVNIPEYRLRAVNNAHAVLGMNVIVGESYEDRATPVFADQMQYVIFRPYWNIPDSIAVKEILPKARRNHRYLARKHYQIVPVFGPNAKPLPVTSDNLDKVEAGTLHFRQTGGAHNSLGLIKFMFPNQYSVYLHSTPANQLFSRTRRDFSHGCVRVQDPAALARFVLEGRPEWTDPARIDQALHEGDRQYVSLARPIPVYLIYWTAFMGEDGVEFRDDLYKHDDELDTAMKRARTRLAATAAAA